MMFLSGMILGAGIGCFTFALLCVGSDRRRKGDDDDAEYHDWGVSGEGEADEPRESGRR